jgi:hypothetical protein
MEPRILCEYSGLERETDKGIRQVSGKERERNRAKTTVFIRINQPKAPFRAKPFKPPPLGVVI